MLRMQQHLWLKAPFILIDWERKGICRVIVSSFDLKQTMLHNKRKSRKKAGNTFITSNTHSSTLTSLAWLSLALSLSYSLSRTLLLNYIALPLLVCVFFSPISLCFLSSIILNKQLFTHCAHTQTNTLSQPILEWAWDWFCSGAKCAVTLKRQWRQIIQIWTSEE